MDDLPQEEPLLVARPILRPKISFAKNLICLFVALLAISVAAIFIVARFYSNRVENSILGVSLLKEQALPLFSSTFKLWGAQPNHDNNEFTHTYRLYNYTGNVTDTNFDSGKFQLVDVPIVFDYSFEYAGATFASGNIGDISLRNRWSLNRRSQQPNDFIINNINLGLNKVFYQFDTLPIQRKFPVLFNAVLESMKQQFLRQFFAEYLFKFFFHDLKLVRETVFAPLGLDQPTQDRLMLDPEFGWNSTAGLQSWMTVCLTMQYDTASYSELRNKFGLTDKQMIGLVGSRSTMYHLTMALNGTIKSKLAVGPASISYNCKDIVCDNDELIGSQWSVGFLTKNELMPGVVLNKTIRDLNSTLEKDFEFSEFCINSGIENKLTIASALPLLSDPNVNLRLIPTVNYIVENRDSFDTIDQYLNAPGSAAAIIRYISQYFYKELLLDGLTNQDFTWAWLAYDNFSELFGRYRWFLLGEYLSRAFQKNFAGLTCQDYFAGDVLGKYAETACNLAKFNITNDKKSYIAYIQGYFFEGRQQFKDELSMQQTDVDYLFASTDSLFASQMKQVLTDLSAHYQCETELCTDKELAYRQWGDNSILSNLPVKYFDVPSVKLLEWDTDNVFKGVPTEYFLQTGKPKNYSEVKKLLSGDGEGLLGLLSLLRRLRNWNPEPIGYLNSVLFGQVYNNLFVQQTPTSYLIGYDDEFVRRQNAKPPISGGTPWQPPTVSLIQLNNTRENKLFDNSELSKINSGIFEQSKLRNWKAINGRYSTGYKTIIDQDENATLLSTWIDTGRPINGTNLLGFRPQLDQKQQLQVYLEQFRRTFNLKFEGKLTDTNYSIFRYSFVEQERELFVGDETLDGRYIKLVTTNLIQSASSYVDVESTTGQTVEFNILVMHLVKPGTLLQSLNGVARLYQQAVQFKRRNFSRYDSMTLDTKRIRGFTIGFIVASSVCFFVVLLLSLLVWRWSKRIIHLDESDDPTVIRTKPTSQITETSFY